MRPRVHRLNADQGFLRRLKASRALPVGICTGTMVLSAAGLTKGRNATTHSGAKAAQRAEVVLEYERRGTVWRA